MLESGIIFDVINTNDAIVNIKLSPKIIQNSVFRIFFRLPPVNKPKSKQKKTKENSKIIPIV